MIRESAGFPCRESTDTVPPVTDARRRLPSLGNLMLIGMGIGVAAGIALGENATRASFLGDIFIRLLTLVAVPLVFFNLITALASSAASGGVSRLLLRIGTFFALTTVAAQLIALAVVGLLRPGAGLAAAAGTSEAAPVAAPGFQDFLFTLVPDNALGVFVDDRVTAVVVLGLMVGFATWGLDRERRADVTRFFASGTALLRQLVSGVLWFGPVGVAALAAASVGEYGSSIFGPLGVYIAAVWIADVAIFALYFAALRFLAATSPLSFVRRTATVWTTTVSTCSSLASLGASLNAAEKMGLPRSTYALTLPLGAQFNKDGSSVLLSGIVLFTAQAVGVSFGVGELLVLIALGTVFSAAAPGVPNGGLVNQFLLLRAFGLPVEIGVLVAGIYRLVDMPTTTANIMGDLVGTMVVTQREKEEPGVVTS